MTHATTDKNQQPQRGDSESRPDVDNYGKVSQAKTETAAVQMIPLDMIQTAPQIRTKFNEASITEMAADIRKHGVLQPLVVQAIGDGRYTLIIGERRLRAIRLAGGTHAPALLAQVAEKDRKEIQLIENIQREDLGAKDLLSAIEALYRKHRSVSRVAGIVNKSKAWVSKKVATAMKMGTLTMQIVDAEIKDMELIYTFATLENADKGAALEILPEILSGKVKRKDMQAALKAVISGNVETGPEKDDRTGDLLADQEQDLAQPYPSPAEIAETALIEIDGMEVLNFERKAKAAIAALRKISQAKT